MLRLMIINVGNGNELSSNAGQGCVHFTLHSQFWKMCEFIWSTKREQIVGQIVFFNLDKADSLGEGQLRKTSLNKLD